MDFDLDDPLRDLLSEGSNDSFFGISTTKKSTAENRNKIESLFGVRKSTEGNEAQNTVKETHGKTTEERKNSPSKNSGGNQATQPENIDSLTKELAVETRKTRPTTTENKPNILDDLLEFSRVSTREIVSNPETLNTSTKSSTNTITTASSAARTIAAANRYSASLNRPRSAQRLKPFETSQNDPLGLHSTSINSDVQTGETMERSARKSAPVDWLGLNIAKSEEQKEKTREEISSNIPNQTAITLPQTNAFDELISSQANIDSESNLLNKMKLFNQTAVDRQVATQKINGQESQLRIANQMKQQEHSLNNQRTLLKQQEDQFNDLLQRQIDRQNALEESIGQQQQRINSYMNLLMTQPITTTSLDNIRADDCDQTHGKAVQQQSDSKSTLIELEAEVKQLELEKLRLEDMLQSIRTSHEQELNLLESSHK